VEPGSPAWSFRAPLAPAAEDSLVEERLASDSLRGFLHFPFLEIFGFFGFSPFFFFFGLIFLNLHLPKQQSLSLLQLDLHFVHLLLMQFEEQQFESKLQNELFPLQVGGGTKMGFCRIGAGMANGCTEGVPAGSSSGMTTGWPEGIPVGLAEEMNGMTTGWPDGIPVGLAEDLATGLIKGIPDGSDESKALEVGPRAAEVGPLTEVGNSEGVLEGRLLLDGLFDEGTGTLGRPGKPTVGVVTIGAVGRGATGWLVAIEVVGMAPTVGLAVGPVATAIDQLPELLSKVK
jgi:hypothetical protein